MRAKIKSVGSYVYGLSAIVLGLVGLVSGDFADVWQPVPAGTPGRSALAYLVAMLFIGSGLAFLSRRAERKSAMVLAALYSVFAILWVPRVAAHVTSLGTWNGVFEQLALVAAAIVCIADRSSHIGRRLFGVCLLSFGATHFSALDATAQLVPTWLPPSPRFWAEATGVFHIAAGLAILFDVAAVPAARLFTAMLVGFGAIVWAPRLVAHPQVHMLWAANAVNFTLVGAAWLMADAIAGLDVAGSRGHHPGRSVHSLDELPASRQSAVSVDGDYPVSARVRVQSRTGAGRRSSF